VLFFLLLADRSGGNDRVATARILQQEKYGLAGVNLTTANSAGWPDRRGCTPSAVRPYESVVKAGSREGRSC